MSVISSKYELYQHASPQSTMTIKGKEPFVWNPFTGWQICFPGFLMSLRKFFPFHLNEVTDGWLPSLVVSKSIRLKSQSEMGVHYWNSQSYVKSLNHQLLRNSFMANMKPEIHFRELYNWNSFPVWIFKCMKSKHQVRSASIKKEAGNATDSHTSKIIYLHTNTTVREFY